MRMLLKRYFQFNKVYFGLAVLLFVIEVLIAVYAHDAFIRPYVGDFLVVILLYVFIRAFLVTPVIGTAVFVLLFAYLIEFLQYCQVVRLLGLESSSVARTVIGVSFEWGDMIAYTLGVALIIAVEKLLDQRRTNKRNHLSSP